MATIEQLIERVETRLFLMAGLDVQIHAEDQLIEMIRHKYNVLFDDFWYPEFTLFTQTTISASTGQPTDDLSSMILRYKDIHTVYWDEDEDPLPQVTPGSALHRIRTRSMMPSGVKETVLKILPAGETGPIGIWYRTRIADTVWANQEFTTEINMDDEVLLLGTVFDFLVNDASNPIATKEAKEAFMLRQKQVRDAQWNQPIYKRKLDRDGPLTRWE